VAVEQIFLAGAAKAQHPFEQLQRCPPSCNIPFFMGNYDSFCTQHAGFSR